MAKSLATITSEWNTIKNETVAGANTATRVGTAGVDIVEYLEENSGGNNLPFPVDLLLHFSAIPRIFRNASTQHPYKMTFEWNTITQNAWELVLRTEPGGQLLATAHLMKGQIVGIDWGDDFGNPGYMSYYRLGENGQFIDVLFDGGGGSGISEAPSNGKIYGRKNAAWAEIDTDAFLQHLMLSAIGVIRIDALPGVINPNDPDTWTQPKWSSLTGWECQIHNPISNTLINVNLPNGTKVMKDGVYYILEAGGTYKEDPLFDHIAFIEKYVGVVTAESLITLGSPVPGMSVVRWIPDPGLSGGEDDMAQFYDKWSYWPDGVGVAGQGIVLQFGSVVKITGDGSGDAIYYKLRPGATTEVVF